MPTISESPWQEKRERIAICVQDFIEAKPLSIDDSEHVLSARLFGLGLRGQDLRHEVHRAVTEKLEHERKRHVEARRITSPR